MPKDIKIGFEKAQKRCTNRQSERQTDIQIDRQREWTGTNRGGKKHPLPASGDLLSSMANQFENQPAQLGGEDFLPWVELQMRIRKKW